MRPNEDIRRATKPKRHIDGQGRFQPFSFDALDPELSHKPGGQKQRFPFLPGQVPPRGPFGFVTKCGTHIRLLGVASCSKTAQDGSWAPLEAVLGSSWRPPGAVLELSWATLGPIVVMSEVMQRDT